VDQHDPGPRHGQLRRFFARLGPGLITGAADDDPSGISTYSVAGASFGYSQLWMALFSFPMTAAVQLMCARLGLVSGQGLAGAIRLRYPRWVLWGACALLVVANVVNIAADLGGMGAATELVTGVPSRWWQPLYVGLIVVLLVLSSYRAIASTFKWLTMVLFAYVIAAFLASPPWGEVLRSTFVPRVEWTAGYVATFLAVLGTTISPYLFFWQAAQEVEEERAKGRPTGDGRRGATDGELAAARTDVVLGIGFSNVVMYFIVLTTAATLHAHGHRDIATAKEAAEALRPLAGDAAYLLFTLGLVGAGMLGVPVLAGSAAYAVAEAMHWRGSLDDRPPASGRFYGVLVASVLLGLALQALQLDAVKMLFWAAVINGLLAPPLLALVVLLTSDPRVMGDRVNPWWLATLGWGTTAVMTVAGAVLIGMSAVS
jgi:NRAMP (natural resistance-associated macrophage protein)-like metal ion transporter